jgi:hypothetical protein
LVRLPVWVLKAKIEKTVANQWGMAERVGFEPTVRLPVQRFSSSMISADTACVMGECEQTRTELYLNTVPLINSCSVALLDNERMMNQLVSLERKTSSVKDRVDHPVGMHDDLANARAGAIVMAQQGSSYSQQQAWKDNLKLNAVYKKWARSVA